MARLRLFILCLVVGLAAVLFTGCGSHPAHHGGRVHSAQFIQQAERAHVPQSLYTAPFAQGVFTLQGYDSVNLSSIPGSAAVVGCYASGPYANCGAASARWPHAHIVTIATYAGAAARCLDTEPGDAVPSQDPGWVKWMISRGVYRPCIYASLSQMGSVRFYLSNAGLARSSYTLWVAAWDGVSSVPSGYDGHQWASNCCIDHDSFLSTFFQAPPSHHYEWFIGTPIASPWGSLIERRLVENYDLWRPNWRQYHAALVNIRTKLLWESERLSYLYSHQSSARNAEFHVWGRAYNDYRRAQSRTCESFSACAH